MSKENRFLDGLIAFLAILGGAFLVNEMFKDSKNYYECPTCKYKKLEWEMTYCPNCKTKLLWEKTK